MPNPPKHTQFKPGQSGNPKGRPAGRDALANKFTEDILADWIANGVSVIAVVRDKDPSTYMRVVAQLLPKETKLDVEHSGAIEHRGLPEISARITELLAARTDRDSPALLPH